MITGNCLCETVSWQISGKLSPMANCHCSMCRKAHGTPFATYCSVKLDGFEWMSGEEAITHFESSPGFVRASCSQCGSVVPDQFGKDLMSIPAGCLNGDPGVEPVAHIFAPFKAPWHSITDDLPQHAGYPKDADAQVEAPTESAPETGPLKGSCLCGEIAFEVTTPIGPVYNCHCSRCRRARGAAHATNGFTAIDGLTFLRGEELLKSFKVPTAKSFTQVFCGKCGSAMPRKNLERGVALIPFGCLDNDPGRTADANIFTGSVAPWHKITDDLPQFEEMP